MPQRTNPVPETWRTSALGLAGVVELVPTAWIAELRNPQASDVTDLADGSYGDLDRLWNDLLRHGMRDPLILRVGRRTRQARLDTGNHRVKVFIAKGIAFMPAAVEIGRWPIKRPTGRHAFDRAHDLLPAIDQASDEFWLPPSEAFRSLRDLRLAGALPHYEPDDGMRARAVRLDVVK